MTVECEHEWVPGEPFKNPKLWEIYACHVRCKKCGYVSPNLFGGPPETIFRMRARMKYASDEAYEAHLIETAERYRQMNIVDIVI